MGKKGTKRKTRWRVLPIGGEDGGCSNNEDEVEGERDSASPPTAGTSYARASGQQRISRTKSSTSSRGGNYNYRHRCFYQESQNNYQPHVTTEKKTFNEEEYTKITTPRQDVLFKKGYLGRKRPPAETTANVNPDTLANVDVNVDQNGDEHTGSDVFEEQPQFLFAAANGGYVDQAGSLYFVNGTGYELYDPFSGNVTVLVGPPPQYGGPGGGPPVLAAVPCQPLPLQPLEWFNPAFLPYVTAPCHNGLASARDRRKRYSTDSQNCSPQSSESTEPPGSPQECDGEVSQPLYSHPPSYVYPGYMFGPPMYNVNGVTLQGAPTQPPSCDIAGSNKRRKKKRRKRRRRGGAEDGCSEESSSDEKELEEPMSVTSQESSSQEIESDSKQSINTITVNVSSLSSPLSSCQILTPTHCTNSSAWLKLAEEQKSAFDSLTPLQVQSQKENLSSLLAAKDICSEQKISNSKSVEEKVYHTSKQIIDEAGEGNSVQLLEDTKIILYSDPPSTTEHNSLNEKELLNHTANNKSTDADYVKNLQEVNIDGGNTFLSDDKCENKDTGTETILHCNGSVSNEGSTKIDDPAKVITGKQEKSGKQSILKHKKNSKGKEDKQNRPTKLSNSDVLKKSNKKKDEKIIANCIVNGIPSEKAVELNIILKKQVKTIEEDKDVLNSKDLDTLISNMEGNESKTPQEQMQTTHDSNLNSEVDSGTERTKSKEGPPIRPVRKEKPRSHTTSSMMTDVKSMDLSPISLRPDGPKFETKTLHELPSSQLKGTTDILDSITEALIKEPTLQSTAHRDMSYSLREKEEQETLKVLDDSVMAASKLESPSSQVPIPPPRCKKSIDSSKQKTTNLIDSLSLDTADVKEESSGDSTTSSTTHQSEESVIELLSSTITSPDDRQNMGLSSDDEEGIIFREKKYTKSEIMDIKLISPDKSDVFTPSISGPSLKDSSQFSEKNELISPESLKDVHQSKQHLKLYAAELSNIVIFEAVHEASKKTFTRPITDAVTRWLRSQSPEVLSLPPPEDESESDVSMEEQGQDPKDGDRKEMTTGQKNVLCNPLPAPSLEDCNHLSVNNCVNHRACSDGTGRRVALNQNDSIYENDNNEIAICAPLVARDKSLMSENENQICLTGGKKFCTHNTHFIKQNYSTLNFQSGCTPKTSIFNNSNMLEMITKDCSLEFGSLTNKLQITNSYKLENISAEMSKIGNMKEVNEDEVSKSNLLEEGGFSFRSECEWDHWDCNPKNPTPIEDVLGKSPEDYCSQICDPAISVAKYYSLGIVQQDKKKCLKVDENEEESESINSSEEEEIDALKHFQHEFDDDDDGLQKNKNIYGNIEIYRSHYGEGVPRICFENDNDRNTQRSQTTRLFDRNSSFLVSRLKGNGPFPCGGICCILQ